MAQKNIKEVIALVAKKLNKAKIKWALIGGSNLALQGMFIKPNDVDILADASDVETVKKIFKQYEILKNSILESGEAHEITYLVDGVEVQFCFEFKHGFYYQFLAKNKITKIILGNEPIFCLELEAENKGYEYLGRHERAAQIKEFRETKFDFNQFEELLTFANNAYHWRNISGQAMRPGGPMPYSAHPLWAAFMLANDRRLSLADRAFGFQILVLHDVLEDTCEKIPNWISKDVVNLVKEMTFKDWKEKKESIKSKSKFVKLLLLSDGLANMYEETVGEKKRAEYKKQVAYLLKESAKNYPESRMVQVGKAILDNTNW